MKQNILILFAILVLVGLGIASKMYTPLSYDVSEVVSGKTYTNERGETWGPLPESPYLFQVASAESEGPRFLEGKIEPPDVHPGDLQRFRIVVQSFTGIKSVIANIETDT